MTAVASKQRPPAPLAGQQQRVAPRQEGLVGQGGAVEAGEVVWGGRVPNRVHHCTRMAAAEVTTAQEWRQPKLPLHKNGGSQSYHCTRMAAAEVPSRCWQGGAFTGQGSRRSWLGLKPCPPLQRNTCPDDAHAAAPRSDDLTACGSSCCCEAAVRPSPQQQCDSSCTAAVRPSPQQHNTAAHLSWAVAPLRR